MILVFDTNVFLQPHRNLWELLDYLPTNEAPPKFLIGLDKDGEIENEYLEQAIQATGRGDFDADIRVITEKIMDSTSLFVVKLSAGLSLVVPIGRYLYDVEEFTQAGGLPNGTKNRT